MGKKEKMEYKKRKRWTLRETVSTDLLHDYRLPHNQSIRVKVWRVVGYCSLGRSDDLTLRRGWREIHEHDERGIVKHIQYGFSQKAKS